MSHSYEIVPATPLHLSMISRRIRAEDKAEIEAGGDVPRHLVYRLWQKSFVARAGFVDGEIAAVFGCAGSLLSSVGEMWLVTAPPIERVPIAFAKEARAMIREMLGHKRTLVSACVEGYEKSLRLWSMLGFQIGEAVAVPPHGAMFRSLTFSRTAEAVAKKPFIIFALPRSRTTWLSSFLSYGGWECGHEDAMRLRRVEDISVYFSRPNVGTVETAAGPGWDLFRHFVPDSNIVVVRRPLEETVAAMIAAGRAGGVIYDVERLRTTMAYGDRMLDKISRHPGVLSVAYSDLWREDTCARIFEHCLPYKFDRAWWGHMQARHINVDLRAYFAEYQRDKPAIDDFKRLCKMELIRLARSGALNNG